MATAAYTLKLINAKRMLLSDFEKTTNGYIPIAELYRWLGIDKESFPQLKDFIVNNCLGDIYESNRPCFKIALNGKNKPALYLVEKALVWFLKTYQLKLHQMGIQKEKINATIDRFTSRKKTDDTFPLHHLLGQLKKRPHPFKYHTLSRKTIEALLRDTYIDETGQEKPLLFFTTIASKMYLTVERKNISHLLSKWGKTFELDDETIQKSSYSNQLPDITDQMIEVGAFAKESLSSDGFMYWLKGMSETFFKSDFEGKDPFFVKAKTDNMQEVICLYKDKIPQFIQKHKALLLLHGLNPTILKEKEAPLSNPLLRLNQLTQILGKGTFFIPSVKEFILTHCMEDTFDLKTGQNQTVSAPVFLYYKRFSSEPTLYIYEQAIPLFVNKHFKELLQLDMSFNTLNHILKTTDNEFLTSSKFWTIKDFYLYSNSPLSLKEFESVLMQNKERTYSLQQKNTEIRDFPIILETSNELTLPKIHISAIKTILDSFQFDLKLSTFDCERILKMASFEQDPPVLLAKEIAEKIDVPMKNSLKLKKMVESIPNRSLSFETENKKYIVPVLGYSKSKRAGFKYGVFESALPLLLSHFKEQFIAFGANEEKLNQLIQNERDNQPFFMFKSKAQKVVSHSKKIQSDAKTKQREI